MPPVGSTLANDWIALTAVPAYRLFRFLRCHPAWNRSLIATFLASDDCDCSFAIKDFFGCLHFFNPSVLEEGYL
jgi:hypothetical protein